ncbi:MAG: nuclear transport factor 2 family protein [Bacteroidota bacterium]
MNHQFSTREQIIETVNRLFVYTDYRKWDQLLNEVFAPEVFFDVSSLGGGPAEKIAASAITKMWQEGLAGLDAIHHQSGNFLIETDGIEATVFAYAIASHYKKEAKNGHVREFIGSYDLHLVKTENGWRIDQFKYNLKYTDGNMALN